MGVKDILLDDDGGLTITGGDLVIGAADQQHQRVLLLTAPGESTQHPTTGIGLVNYLEDDEFPGKLRGRIISEFEADGMKNIRISGNTFENIKINANYS